MRSPKRVAPALAGALCLLLATSCSSIPADSEGTLDRVRGGTLVVGASEHEPWVVVGDDGEPTGTEVALVESFADSLGAEIEWELGPESILADGVKNSEIDIVIGGLTSKSPWSSDMALTRPYTTVMSEKGQKQSIVMGVPKGENAFMTALETHLASEQGEI
jgi:polar amino acid transport system substrate-binding protein